MGFWRWEVIEDDFEVRTEEGYAGTGGEHRYFIKFKDEPYKVKVENEDGSVIYLSVFSDPDLVKPPGMFNLEYRIGGRNDYELVSFSKTSQVEDWLDERGITERPDLWRIYAKMIGLTEDIIRITKEHGFGVSVWAEEWLTEWRQKQEDALMGLKTTSNILRDM